MKYQLKAECNNNRIINIELDNDNELKQTIEFNTYWTNYIKMFFNVTKVKKLTLVKLGD